MLCRQDIHTRSSHEIFINKPQAHTLRHFAASAKRTMCLSATHSPSHSHTNTNQIIQSVCPISIRFPFQTVISNNLLHFEFVFLCLAFEFCFIFLAGDYNSVKVIWCMQFSHKNFNILFFSQNYFIWCVLNESMSILVIKHSFSLIIPIFFVLVWNEMKFKTLIFGWFGSDCVCLSHSLCVCNLVGIINLKVGQYYIKCI